ncbi:hypothetical protein AB0H88_07355 [Nonomuraea sp. NPDC050680]|uniref:hypothetical protein n=1 Tax=Nonomuraea sp. NPDC050680 TaxID=3154630 RepID=UPI0033EAD8A2
MTTTRIMTAALMCTMLLSACSDASEEDRPPEPAVVPTVAAQEWQQRLTTHLSRFVTGGLSPGARASKPAVSRVAGCGDDSPAWGVLPQAKIAVSVGGQVRKTLDDAQQWMSNNGFVDVDEDFEEGRGHVVSGVHADGTHMRAQLSAETEKPNADKVESGKKDAAVGQTFTITASGSCAWPSDRPGGPPPTGRLPSLAAPAGPTTATDKTSACRSPRIAVYNAEARPYAGRGPHLMALASYTDENPLVYAEFGLDDRWKPRGEDFERAEEEVQLLICVRVETTRDSGRNVTCSYSSISGIEFGFPHTFDVFESVYRVVVREALSGRVVRRFTVPGTQANKDSCPLEMVKPTRNLARGIDGKAFERKLRPLFDDSRSTR